MQDKISLVMIVKNEEKVLARCLDSVKPYVDEMIIVDTGSCDKTVDIAKKFTADVYSYEWCNDFSKARNFALSKASNSYRLVMDADEYILEWDTEAVHQLLKDKIIGVVNLIDVFEQEGEIKQSKSHLSRLLSETAHYEGAIHEQVVDNCKRKQLPIYIGHDGYLYTDKSERNLEILYKVVKQKPNHSYYIYQLAHTLFVAKKHQEADLYYRQYYKISKVNESYRCGAIVDYLYNSMAIGKIEEGLKIIQAEEKRYSTSSDFHFVCGHFYRELVLYDTNKYINYLPYIEKSFLRCLEIGENDASEGVIGTGSFEAAYNLAAWYEVVGQIDSAKYYYNLSAEAGYERAIEKLKEF